jgi:hypothetical protein
VRLPTAPGAAECSCPVWQPLQARDAAAQRLQGWFVGAAPQLADDAFIDGLDTRFEVRPQGLCAASAAGAGLSPAPAGGARRAGLTAAAGGAQGGRGDTAAHQSLSHRVTSQLGQALHTCGTGGRLALRLHVLTRNMAALPLVAQPAWGGALAGAAAAAAAAAGRGGGGGGKPRGAPVWGPATDEDDCGGSGDRTVSEGLRLVRAGRAGRLGVA